MRKMISFIAGAALALTAAAATAQPSESADQASRSINPYVYMSDAHGDKVLVSTTFWRNDQEYDVRSLRRLYAVMSNLEKLGFKKNDQASIDWNKKENVIRCAIYLESRQAGRGGKTGTRVWCEGSGLGEFTVSPSDEPKHVDIVMKRFETQYAGAKRNLGK
ncbi:MAG: hypothetical protein KGL70_10025 [Betaproteobacteria bacterium]|nr:hypothetical protein [Betaproteobacteria bacterium]